MRVWAPQKVFLHRPDAVLSQMPPVAGTWYTILDTTENCRVISIAVVASSTPLTSLSVMITIDGRSFTMSVASPNSTQIYCVTNSEEIGADLFLGVDTWAATRSFLIEGRSVKISAMVQGSNLQQLVGRVKYATL